MNKICPNLKRKLGRTTDGEKISVIVRFLQAPLPNWQMCRIRDIGLVRAGPSIFSVEYLTRSQIEQLNKLSFVTRISHPWLAKAQVQETT